MAFVSAATSARSYSASDRVGSPASSVVRVIGNGIHDGLNQAREQSKIAAAGTEFSSPEIFATSPRIITTHPRACMPPVKRPRGRVLFRSQHAGSQLLLNASDMHRLVVSPTSRHRRRYMIDAGAGRWLSGAANPGCFARFALSHIARIRSFLASCSCAV
jgi:hypothetical protein